MTLEGHRLATRAISLVALMLIGFPSTGASRGDYIYDGLMTGQSVYLQSERKSLSLGHSVFPASLCAPTDEFHCFHGEAIGFAVPKSDCTERKEWLVEGRKYVLTVPLHRREILGRVHNDVCVIESSHKYRGERVSSRYLYSPANGLLAMEVRVFSEGRWSGDVYVLRSLFLAGPTGSDSGQRVRGFPR